MSRNLVMGCVCLLVVVGKVLAQPATPIVIEGVTVTPHVRAERIIYHRERQGELGARVEIFLRNASSEAVSIHSARFGDKFPQELLAQRQWSWHSVLAAPLVELPAGARFVWSFNARTADWAAGAEASLQLDTSKGQCTLPLALDPPTAWISAVTFLGESVHPDRVVCHVQNETEDSLRVEGLTLFVPTDRQTWQCLDREVQPLEVHTWPADGVIPSHDRGIVEARCEDLPSSYAIVRVEFADGRSLFAHLRIKREVFDISGGWVNSDTAVGPSITYEPFLKTLARLHVNTAHLQFTPGYSDRAELYANYPLKYFGALRPFEQYDQEAMLPHVHAVEFLGEPQYPNPEDPETPQQVYDALLPYASTRLPTSVTLSDESTWRHYAGLSDYPHYDSYRVVAPHVDAWSKYDRWKGQRIHWGSPLEGIGDLTRSLRDLSRPKPTAYWSQGPHDGWDGFDGRRRGSPTAGEIRLQAYHALAARITSLYWFNLSPKSLVRYRDTLDAMARIGREIKLLEPFYLEGDAFQYQTDGAWDCSSIVAPEGALLFALDLQYGIAAREPVFEFGPPRAGEFAFDLPAFLRQPEDVFRVDADGTHDVSWRATQRGVVLEDQLCKVGIYVATRDRELRTRLEQRRGELVEYEESLGFDPAANDGDFEQLSAMLDDEG